MNARENKIRAIRFETPEYIPMTLHINPACYNHYDCNALFDIMESHTMLFPDFIRPDADTFKPHYNVNQLKEKDYKDPWGCVWQTVEDGITGAVHDHPLETWDNFDDYKAPNPMLTDGTFLINWDNIEKSVIEKKKNGEFVEGGLPHGHTFLRIQDIRGYENFLFDMVDEHPNILKLIQMVESFNYEYIQKFLSLEPDMISYPEDLGMQVGPMISPDHFRKFIKPSYQRLMKPARDAGVIVHMHSDGDIRDLLDDIIEGGVESINLQDLVNGIDWIAETLGGKVCVDLDIDRQDIAVNGSPKDIDALIKEEVSKIGRKEGGLMMIHGVYAGMPLENIEAMADAMERYSLYFS